MSETSTPRAEVLRTRDFVGWAVTGRDGANVGTVSDILIDRTGTVRFLAVSRGLLRKHALVPVEVLEWGEGSLVAGWSDADLRGLPPYDPDVPLSGPVLEELAMAYPRYYRHGGPPPPPLSSEGAQVVPLKEARDFKLAKGAPNLRGWTVYGSDHEKVGIVTGMLVDPVAMKIRYLDVDLDDDLFALRDDRHVLVPMESVELRERSEDAWIGTATSREIARMPAYTGGPVDPLVEEAVARTFRLESGGAGLFEPAVDRDETALFPPQYGEPPALPSSSGVPGDAPPPSDSYSSPPIDDPAGAGAPPPLPPEERGYRPPEYVDEAWSLEEDEERRRRGGF